MRKAKLESFDDKIEDLQNHVHKSDSYLSERAKRVKTERSDRLLSKIS